MLHSLRFADSGKYVFTPQLLNINQALSLQMPPCQVLLDIVELETDEALFAELFGVTGSVKIDILTQFPSFKLTATEHLVFTNVEETNTAKALADLLLLSDFDVKKALLSLQAHEAISLPTQSLFSAPTSQPKPPRAAPIAPMRDNVKKAVSNIDEGELFDHAASLLVEGDIENEDLDERVEVTKSGKVRTQSSLKFSDVDTIRMTQEQAASELENDDEQTGFESANTNSPSQDSGLSEVVSDYSARMLAFNYRALEPDLNCFIALLVMMAYLFVVGFVCPTQINRWFDAISLFSKIGT